MAEEAIVAIGTTATLTPLIEIYYNGVHELTSAQVIQKINECVSHDKQIDLFLVFGGDEDDENYQLFRFDTTGAMQNTIVENSRHIKKIAICNYCKEKGEHRRCFTFFTRIVRGIIGKGKHLTYYSPSRKHEFELEQANQLAQALRSNNNNNGAIDSFRFDLYKLTTVTFQLLWNSLLDSGVRKITFGNYYKSSDNNNNIIDFTGMETNESLKELDLGGFDMRKEDCRSLFHSLKKNTGLEKLELDYTTYKNLSTRMKRLFEEMMCENITLSHCCLWHGDVQDRIFEVIHFQMKVNRMWKRYLMQREREKKTRTVMTRIEEGGNNDNNNNNDNDNNNEAEEEERKKRLKMRLLLHLFMKKPVMRDTIIFHLLREYPDDLGLLTNDDTQQQHQQQQQQQSPLLLRMIRSNVAKKKWRRTTGTDDGENKSNEGTADPNDNDGVVNWCESGSDDGTDGTF